MSKDSLVSVIIIFLNEAKFIQEAIASVFSQTYVNWELILVDDGSFDGSSKIASRCAAQRPENVRYFEHHGHENHGMSASRNLGIRHARGEYIALLDADDIWLPHKLEEQVRIMASQAEAAMVYGASQYWHSWTGNSEDIESDYMPKLGIEPDTMVRPFTLLTRSLESRCPTPCPSDILLRREIVERVGGFEESFTGVYQLYEDQAFLAKLYLKAPVFVSSACWDRYRQHPESCVAVAQREGREYAVGLFYLNWLEKYLLAQGVQDKELWDALIKKRRRYRHPKLSRLLSRAHNRLEPMTNLVKVTARRFQK